MGDSLQRRRSKRSRSSTLSKNCENLRSATSTPSKRPWPSCNANPVDPESLDRYLFWNAQHYTRNLIDKTELYELMARSAGKLA